MRLATAANEAYTASLAVSELLGCKQCGGGRGQDEVPGRAGWAGGRLGGRTRRAARAAAWSVASHFSPEQLWRTLPWQGAPEATARWPPWAAGRLGLVCVPSGDGRPVRQGWGDVPTVVPAAPLRSERQLARSFKWKSSKRK